MNITITEFTDCRGKDRKSRIARTTGSTGPLFRIGELLAARDHGPKTRAEYLCEGKTIDVKIYMSGSDPEGTFRLSLSSINIWGCPFCGSAHGSGVHPSSDLYAPSLATNMFYYNPATRQLFTISKTCLHNHPELRITGTSSVRTECDITGTESTTAPCSQVENASIYTDDHTWIPE
jgi:hypothetical protein